jgi:uncharacterized repeat protein (TIGR03803 family)
MKMYEFLLSTTRTLATLAFLASSVTVGLPQSVEKVADLNFVAIDGVGLGGYEPLARFTQVGTNLWFTTDKGGTFDAGTISRFDLVTREVVQVASFDNATGKSSESALLVIGDDGYFTTKSGGAGNKGTIAKVNLSSGAITVLHEFQADSALGATPRSSLTRIGDELWTTTSLGGTSNRGVIVLYNLTNGVTSVVTNFDGPEIGGQAFGGFTPVGSNTWYYTTFTGGSTFGTSGLNLGAGVLGRLSFDENGNAVVTRVADMAAGYTQFPGLEPTLVGTNSLYFGTTGPNSSPGAIIRYDLDTGIWTNLFSFRTNAVDALNYGTRPGYSGMVEWLGELYFLTRQGGTSNLGVVAKFNIASNTVTKLADFEGTGGLALGRSTGIFDNTGVIVEEAERFYIYYTVTTGGVNNRGTIVRVVLPAPPIQSSLVSTNAGELTLSWTGGYAPFTVEGTGDLASGSWTNVMTGVTNRSIAIPAGDSVGFFRINGSQ